MKKSILTVLFSLLAFSQLFSASPCGVIGVDWTAATCNAAFDARYRHGAESFDDGTGEKMWVFAGAKSAYPHFKDVWYSSNGSDWSMATGNAAFGERGSFSTYKFNNKIWIAGGDNNGVTKNDVWNSTDMRVWAAVTMNAAFSARTVQTGILHNTGSGERMWVIAGMTTMNVNSVLNDVWSSADGSNWTMATSSAAFVKRMGAGGVSYNGKMWISGGMNSTTAVLNDVWWSSDGVNWNVATTNASFPARHLHTMVVYDNKMWVIGGSTYANGVTYRDAWWSTNGVNWYNASLDINTAGGDKAGAIIYNSQLWITGGSIQKDAWYTCGASISMPTPTVTVTATVTPTITRTSTPLPTVTSVCGITGVNWYSATLNAPFAVRHEQGGLVFNNKMWVIGGGGPTWPNEKDVWNSSDGVNWSAATLNAAFGPRGAGGYVVYDNGTGSKMWVIGGERDGVWQKDVWYSSNGADWFLATGNAAFGPKVCHTALVYNNKMWVMGGSNGSAKNDVWWSTNGADWFIATGNAAWSPRCYIGSTVYNNKMWVIGGALQDGTNPKSDVWSSTDGVTWTLATNSFPTRSHTKAEVFDNKLWIISGYNGGTLNDVWYSLDGSTWTNATNSALSGARYDGSSYVYNNRMWYIAGCVNVPSQFNDVWYTGCNVSTATATPVATNTPTPQPVISPVCGTIGVDWNAATLNAAFSGRHELGNLVFNNKMWVLGGAGPSYPHYSDTWSSTNGVNWTLENGAAAFGQRAGGGCLVFNNGTGEKMWMITGERNGAWLKDIWYSSNGIDWQMATGNAAFGTRVKEGSCVYNNKMWIAGGYNGANKNDVWWSSNGADWFQATGNAAWSPRSNPCLVVYDNGTGSKMWIIGGGPEGGTSGYGDVWSSTDGANWTLATTSFPPRFQARAEVFDGKLWVIGGVYGSSLSDILYTTNGSTWIQAAASTAIGAKSDGATCVYDNRMWYTGGYKIGVLNYNQVWYTCGSSIATPTYTRTITPTITRTSTPSMTVTSTVTPVPVISPVCGTIGVDWHAATTSAPFSIRHSQANMIFNNKMWLLGGGGPAYPHFSDVWSSTNGIHWTLEKAVAAFGQRCGSGAVVFNNGTGDKMWLIGGERNGVRLNDVWYSSNGVDWYLATGNAAFSPRQAPGAFVYNNKMWIAGGYNGTDKNDVWWSSNGADWFQATSNAAWIPRSYAACAVYNNGTGSKMWLVGGGIGGTVNGYSDVWTSTDGANWTLETAVSFPPRFQSRAEVFDGKLWIIGGISGVRLNEVWYTVNGTNWFLANGSPAFAPRSDGATFVYDNRMWYIAGLQTLGLQYNDVWYTCGSSIMTPTNTPTYTMTLVPTPAATPDCAAIGNTWVNVTNSGAFGNRNLQTTLSYGGWLWTMLGSNGVYPHFSSVYKSTDGNTWTLAASNTSLGQRAGQGGVIFNNLVYVAGGSANGTYKNDVWHSSDVTSWTVDTLAAPFSPRANFGFLAFNSKLWVIGGSNGTGTDLKDVWYSSDAVNWTLATSNGAFGPTCAMQPVVFDNKMWILGGSKSGTISAEIWNSTDGITWNLVTASAPFGPRQHPVCNVYDGKIWVIGGQAPANKTDAWYSTDGINWTLQNANTGIVYAAGGASAVFNNIFYLNGGNYTSQVWKMGCFVAPTMTSTPTATPTSTPDCAAIGNNWVNVTNSGAFGNRNLHTTLSYDGWLWTICGVYTGYPHISSVYKSNDGNNWSLVAASTGLGQRAGQVGVVFNNLMYVAGGSANGTYKSDVWHSSNGVTWTADTLAAPFSPRANFGFLSFNSKLWVIGGSNGTGTDLKDVWYSSDAVNWTLANSNAAFGPTCAIQPVVFNNKMWILGGMKSGTVSSEIWNSSDGITWTLVTAAAPFGPRQHTVCNVYDGKIWVVGGQPQTGNTTDAWYSTDGINWVRQTANTGIVYAAGGASAILNNIFYLNGGNYTSQVWKMGCAVATTVPTLPPTAVPTTPIPQPTFTPTLTPTMTPPVVVPTFPTIVISTPTVEPVPTVDDGDSTCYPTKAKDHVKIVFNINKKADVKIYIYDISGKLVKTVDMTTGETPNEKLYKVNVDVRSLEPGIYYYVIQGKTLSGELINFKSKKFIVQSK